MITKTKINKTAEHPRSLQNQDRRLFLKQGFAVSFTLMFGGCGGGGGGGGGTTGGAMAGVKPVAVPVAIIRQPVSQRITAGESASFSVSVRGTSPIRYQWRRNGVNIAGATSRSLLTAPATRGDDGSLYSVLVSNPQGSIESIGAVLTVAPTLSVDSTAITIDSTQFTVDEA